MTTRSKSRDGSRKEGGSGRWDPRAVVRSGAMPRHRSDVYLFLLEASWPRLVLVFGLVYVAANAVFATVYVLGGDSIENARPGSFVDAFFFSVQTMATIGFGKLIPRTVLANILV